MSFTERLNLETLALTNHADRHYNFIASACHERSYFLKKKKINHSCIVFLCLRTLFQVQIIGNFIDFSGYILEFCTYKCIQNLFVLLKSCHCEQLRVPKTLLNCIFTKQAIWFSRVRAGKEDCYTVLLLSDTKKYSSSVALTHIYVSV